MIRKPPRNHSYVNIPPYCDTMDFITMFDFPKILSIDCKYRYQSTVNHKLEMNTYWYSKVYIYVCIGKPLLSIPNKPCKYI